ncbi:CGNR zinc finger domain-containing protein [Pseudonocardia kunmingensis]|uniref:CGNR zinc finger protein n=1 Tax=Pseudonocardia kunmingensis TaxID=630975 RepID=A0A543CZK7_9PSEU|nr:CGNR zinc finger domain-containing protein [Pseudonocardia kunmingensis]TQM02338.1 CGNR zinc finger protein [Pseudonocardia kunmingensis]
MDFIGYRSDALGAAVDLVNAVIEDPEGRVPDQLRGVLVAHAYHAMDAPDSIEPALRAWARRLRTAFEVSTVEEAAAAINALLVDVSVEPHLTCHDDTEGWHLHYAAPEAGLVDRMRATTAFALAMLVSEYGISRHGRCAADGCAKVFADSSRNAARRYCSAACANRSAVAAHRARARARAAGAAPGEARRTAQPSAR